MTKNQSENLINNETCEYNTGECDSNLDKLEGKTFINAPFIKDGDNYKLFLEDEVLDIPLTAEQLVKLYDKVKSSLIAYQGVYEKYTHEEYRDGHFGDYITLDADGIDRTHFSVDLQNELFNDSSDETREKFITFMNKLINNFSNNNKNSEINIETDLDKLNMIENQELINQIQAQSLGNFDGKTIEYILSLEENDSRVQSIINLIKLSKNPIMPGSIGARSLMGMTYEDIPYVVKNSNIRKDRNITFSFNHLCSHVSVNHVGEEIGIFQINNPNDQVIFSILTGKKIYLRLSDVNYILNECTIKEDK